MSVSSGSDITIPIQDSPPPPPSPYANGTGNGAKINDKEKSAGVTNVSVGDSAENAAGKRTPEPRGDVTVTVGFVNEAYQDQSLDDEKKTVKKNEKNGAIQISVSGGDTVGKGENSMDHTEVHLNEAVNPELINMNILNTIPDKPNSEFGPYDNMDEYFVPVNQHKKFLRSEKLYVTKDKRKESKWKKYVCWLVGASILAAIVTVAVLAGIGLIPQKSSNTFTDMIISSSSESSLSSSTEINTPTPPSVPPNATYVPMAAELNFHITDLSYEPALNDKTSERFQKLAKEIQDEVKGILRTRAGLQTVYSRVTEFAPGSVYVKMRIGWADQSMDIHRVKLMLSNVTLVGQYDIMPISTYEVVNLCKFNKNGCSQNCSYDYITMSFYCFGDENSTSSTTASSQLPELSSASYFHEETVSSSASPAVIPEEVESLPEEQASLEPDLPAEPEPEATDVPQLSEEHGSTQEKSTEPASIPQSEIEHESPPEESIVLSSTSTTVQPLSSSSEESAEHRQVIPAAHETTTTTTTTEQSILLNSSEEVTSDESEQTTVPNVSDSIPPTAQGSVEEEMTKTVRPSAEVALQQSLSTANASAEGIEHLEEQVPTDIPSQEDEIPTTIVPDEERIHFETAVPHSEEQSFSAVSQESPEQIDNGLASTTKNDSTPFESFESDSATVPSDMPNESQEQTTASSVDEEQEIITTVTPHVSVQAQRHEEEEHHITPMDVLSFSSQPSTTASSSLHLEPLVTTATTTTTTAAALEISNSSLELEHDQPRSLSAELGSYETELITPADQRYQNLSSIIDDTSTELSPREPRVLSSESGTISEQQIHDDTSEATKNRKREELIAPSNSGQNATESASLETADENPETASVTSVSSEDLSNSREVVTQVTHNVNQQEHPSGENNMSEASSSDSNEFSHEFPTFSGSVETDSSETTTFRPLSLHHDIDINYLDNVTADHVDSEPIVEVETIAASGENANDKEKLVVSEDLSETTVASIQDGNQLGEQETSPTPIVPAATGSRESVSREDTTRSITSEIVENEDSIEYSNRDHRDVNESIESPLPGSTSLESSADLSSVEETLMTTTPEVEAISASTVTAVPPQTPSSADISSTTVTPITSTPFSTSTDETADNHQKLRAGNSSYSSVSFSNLSDESSSSISLESSSSNSQSHEISSPEEILEPGVSSSSAAVASNEGASVSTSNSGSSDDLNNELT